MSDTSAEQEPAKAQESASKQTQEPAQEPATEKAQEPETQKVEGAEPAAEEAFNCKPTVEAYVKKIDEMQANLD